MTDKLTGRLARNLWCAVVCMSLGIASACGDTKALPSACDGTSTVMSTADEPAGTNCQWGGTRFDVGADKNCNGVLDPDEVTTTRYSCNQNGNEFAYLLENLGESVMKMGFNSSATVSFKLTDKDGNAVANSSIAMTVSAKAVSFSEAASVTSTVVQTGADGIAAVDIYSGSSQATATLKVVTIDVESNVQTVEISVRDSEEIDVEGKGSLKVNMVNNAVADGVQKALVKAYYIEADDETPYCDQLLSGQDIGFYDSVETAKVGGGTGSVTFSGIDEGMRVVAFAKGQTTGGIDVGSNACGISDPIVSKQTSNLSLTLEALPEAVISLDKGYDTMLSLDLSKIMPASWQKWFNLIDELFHSPTATAIYYALHYWEYHGEYATTGGGSNVQFSAMSGLVNVDLNVWDEVIRGDSLSENDPDPSVSTLLRACDVGGQNPTAACPAIEGIDVGLMTISIPEDYQYLYKVIVELAEEKLAEIPGFGPVYGYIKTVGSNLTDMAKSFDVGARISLEQTSETTVNVHEVWSHVVWTWQLFDDSPECDRNSSDYNADTCGRHAFRMAGNDLASSVVNETYAATIKSSSVTEGVLLELPSDHSFNLGYGALLKVLVNRVVVPTVLNHDADGLNSDGEAFNITGQEDLGDLLNYWVPCTNIATIVYNWLVDTLNSIGGDSGVQLGTLASSFITKESLDGYCELGLNSAADYAMGQLDKLVVDAKLKVRQGGTFSLTDLDRSLVPQTLTDLHYEVGYYHEGSATNYDAEITGEGILENGTPPGIDQCVEFLSLSEAAATAACK